jgi:hypothetical protein
VNAKVEKFTIGGYGLCYNMNTYPQFATGGATEGSMDARFWWLGLYADGKAGPVNLNFDFGYDWGTVSSRLSPSDIAPDVKYRGWATRLKVDYPWEKFNFGFIGMYASGSDTEKTSSNGLPGSETSISTGENPVYSTKVNGWMVPIGSEMGAVNQESAVFYGTDPGASGGNGIAVNHNYTQMSKGAFGGTWFAKLYGSYKVTPSYKLTLQGLYIGDTTKNGNTYGTARNLDGTLRNDKDIGFEFDLFNEFQLYKNLVFKVFGGVLFAGDAMDLWSGNSDVGNFSMKNPWAIRTRLLYTF